MWSEISWSRPRSVRRLAMPASSTAGGASAAAGPHCPAATAAFQSASSSAAVFSRCTVIMGVRCREAIRRQTARLPAPLSSPSNPPGSLRWGGRGDFQVGLSARSAPIRPACGRRACAGRAAGARSEAGPIARSRRVDRPIAQGHCWPAGPARGCRGAGHLRGVLDTAVRDGALGPIQRRSSAGPGSPTEKPRNVRADVRPRTGPRRSPGHGLGPHVGSAAPRPAWSGRVGPSARRGSPP